MISTVYVKVPLDLALHYLYLFRMTYRCHGTIRVYDFENAKRPVAGTAARA
jgi:hypothetical protein